MRIFNSFIASIAATLTVLPKIAIAQYTDLPAGNAVTFDDIGSIITMIARFLIVMSTIVAVIFIVWSGIMMMAAQDDAKKFDAARNRLKHALWGVGVAMGVFVIINTIAGIVTRSFFCQVSFLGICLY